MVSGCFGRNLTGDYKQKISNFNSQYLSLQVFVRERWQGQHKLTVSWKVHCVAAHLVQFLDEFQVGLARYAEQTSEAAHAAIKPTEQRFLVSEQNANHGDQLKTVASVFSGTRVN